MIHRHRCSPPSSSQKQWQGNRRPAGRTGQSFRNHVQCWLRQTSTPLSSSPAPRPRLSAGDKSLHLRWKTGDPRPSPGPTSGRGVFHPGGKERRSVETRANNTGLWSSSLHVSSPPRPCIALAQDSCILMLVTPRAQGKRVPLGPANPRAFRRCCIELRSPGRSQDSLPGLSRKTASRRPTG
ncbi:hypothetical protein LY78DRAFT_75856 [Colletotrichum sublineola]|nr:hypothetical protein LY78DRAFT_75856 [Colletotrichum sublineola]